MSPLSSPCRVAVIGAGAAGIVAARELIRVGHDTVVFERESRIGGTWVYTPETESDPTGHDLYRSMVHSSMYESMRTNLPRELMGFREFPFSAEEEGSGDTRRFPGHEEVLRYIERFAEEFGIGEVIRFGKEVVRAREDGNGRWRVAWRSSRNAAPAEEEEEVFDAVVVCSGHFAVPRTVKIPGIKQYRGKQVHSHNYRTPHPFRDQVVVVIGGGPSSRDISHDMLKFAREIHITCRANDISPLGKQPGHSNLWIHPTIERILEDGSILFLDGTCVHADIMLYCTGYHFPFLEMKGDITVDGDRVGPLYKHVFPPAYAPQLSFVGLIQKVLSSSPPINLIFPKQFKLQCSPTNPRLGQVMPFVQFELQSKWIAGALSGRIPLPSREDMKVEVEEFYAQLEAKGVPKRHTHSIFSSEDLFEYYEWIARECGCGPMEEWRKQMWAKIVITIRKPSRLSEPRTSLDELNEADRELVALAYQQFSRWNPRELQI